MDTTDVQPPEGEPESPEAVVRPVSWRRWVLRGFVLTLLIGGVGAVTVAAVTIVSNAKEPFKRKLVSGVLMPDDSHFRDITGQLLARKRPERLQGLTITGAAGAVTVLRYRPDRTSLLSSYLNPNAFSVIARAIGAHSYSPTVVDALRLGVPRSTGRQRWSLDGTQGGKPWRATINPNGTNLRRVPVKAG